MTTVTTGTSKKAAAAAKTKEFFANAQAKVKATVPSKAKTSRKPKAKPINGDLLPNVEGPMLRFIALDVIDAVTQVRTEFDEGKLQELAEDIKVRGMLQPVLLRPAADNRYIIIAGERRVRAARLAGLSAVTAIVGEVSQEQADDMQLAENIQREELDLNDLAKAVRRLYDREGKIDKVAAIVQKSKSWVSKHLAISCPDLGHRARFLLQEGATDDLELLTLVSNIEKIDYSASWSISGDIQNGKAGRKEARELLAKIKESNDKKKAEIATAKKEAKKAKKNTAPEKKAFWPQGAMSDVHDKLQEENNPGIAAILTEYTKEERQKMLDTTGEAYEQGNLVAHMEPIDKMRRLLQIHAKQYSEEQDNAAFLVGAFGMDWTLENVFAELERSFKD